MMQIFQDSTAWVALSFVIFVVLANVYGRKSVISGLDARIERIRSEIATAEDLKNQAQSLLAEYQQKHDAAAEEAATIVSQAKAQAVQMQEKAASDFEATMARKEAMMQERIQRMEESAMDDIRRYAAELAINATTQIIAQKMDAPTAEKLADASIRKVSDNLN